MKKHTNARPASTRLGRTQIRLPVAERQTKTWKPEPSTISRAEMREIVARMIG